MTGAVDPGGRLTYYGTAPARDDHEIPLRIYRPRSLRDARTDVPVVMWFHGGGWVLGNVVDYDPICTFLAATVGLCRRLGRLPDGARAPGAGGPSRLRRRHDVGRRSTVTCCVRTPRRMAVAGDSAGGNLAAVVAQVLRDHGDTRLRHQALIYPATDLTMASPSIAEHPERPRPHQAVDGRLP